MRKLLYSFAVVLLAATGCGSDSSGGEATDTTGSDGSASEATTTTEASTCPDETTLEIVTGEESEGEIDVVTAWAEGGPHPDNDTDESQNADFVFTDYEIPEDPQFGYGIPVGSADVPSDGTELKLSIFSPDGPIEAGMSFVDQTADPEVLAEHDGEINFNTLYLPGNERATMGEVTMTVTEMTDEVICGEIGGVSRTELQELTAVEGAFVADRLQHVEAEAEAAEEE